MLYLTHAQVREKSAFFRMAHFLRSGCRSIIGGTDVQQVSSGLGLVYIPIGTQGTHCRQLTAAEPFNDTRFS